MQKDSHYKNAQDSLRELLISSLGELRTKNHRYSTRAFAKKLGLTPSALNEFLKGQRRYSAKLAQRVLSRLHVAPEKQNEILDQFSNIETRNNPQSKISFVTLNFDQYRLIADWQHYAILSLIETQDFKSKPEWIANRLGITKKECLSSLERLENLELIKIDRKGKIQTTGLQYSSSDEIINKAVEHSHYQGLELAKKTLSEVSIESRDFTAMTLAYNPQRIPEAKKRIRKFLQELTVYLEGGEKTEVGRIMIQMIPLTIGEKNS